MIINRKISTVRSAKSTRKTDGGQAIDKGIDGKLTESTVYMYGDIGGYFGIDHLAFIQEFNAIDSDITHLRIDSQGGDVFAARAIKTAIQQHKSKVIAHIDGLAASAASFIAMGADEIEMVDGGFFMIHNALSFMDVFGYFNADDLTDLRETIDKEIDLHAKINESIANDYVKKTGNDQSEVLAWMADETWFTAAEALENNFIDRIYDGKPVDGSYDLSVFANAPESLQLRNQKANKRTIEKALRDVGLSNKVAKAVLAGTFSDDFRDEDAVADDSLAVIDGVQRDVEPVEPNQDKVDAADRTKQLLSEAKDKTASLLTRAEVLAPSTI